MCLLAWDEVGRSGEGAGGKGGVGRGGRVAE